MLLNLSNHPINKWKEPQLIEAKRKFGELVQIGFPNVDPHFSGKEVRDAAMKKYTDLTIRYNHADLSILIAGEQSFIMYFCLICVEHGTSLYTAAGPRDATTDSEGRKVVSFHFNRFRKIC